MSEYFYIARYSTKTEISRSLLPGPTATEPVLSELPEHVLSMAASTDHIYWVTHTPGFAVPYINRAKIDGTELQNEWIAWGSAEHVLVAVDETYLYFTRYRSGSKTTWLGRVKLDGSEFNESFAQLFTGNEELNALVVDSQHIYWRQGEFGEGRIGRAKIDGSEVIPHWTNIKRSVGTLALDAGHVYFDQHSEGHIGRVQKDGTNLEENWIEIPETFQEIHGIVITENHLYYLGTELLAEKAYIANINLTTKASINHWLSLGNIESLGYPDALAVSPEKAGPPVITNPGPQVNSVGESPFLAIEASHATTYEATGLPVGLVINHSTGLISGKLTTIEEARITITVVGPGGTSSIEFTWDVICVKPSDPGAPWKLVPIVSAKVLPGDAIISSSTGTVWKNVSGVLKPLTEASKFSLVEKYVKQPGPFFYNTAYIASAEFVTLAVISPKEQNPSHVFIGEAEVAEIEYHGSVVPMTFIIPAGQTWMIKAAVSEELKSVAYAFFPS